MHDQLISEPIAPVIGAMNPQQMARGAPALPERFFWRGEEHAVAEVLESWKETSGCKSGSEEQYVRKHWFRIRTTKGLEMKLYFERQARSRSERKRRWWLYTVIADRADR
jgi:hypothetical protein